MKRRRSPLKKPPKAIERDYLSWLMAERNWSWREANVYARRGEAGLAIERGRIAREQKANTMAMQVEISEEHIDARGIERLWSPCYLQRCTLPNNHSGPHNYRRPLLISDADVEECDPP